MIKSKSLMRAASSALIDMHTADGEWEAIETNVDGSTVVVTLRRRAEWRHPQACICPDLGGDIDPSCEFCLDGPRDDDYLDVTFAVEAVS